MRLSAIVFIVAFSLSTPACVGGTIHGLDKEEWMELLAGDGALPFKAGDDVDYEAVMGLGPGAILFVGMAAQDRGEDGLAATLFLEATKRESGVYRERAAALLGDVLVGMKDGAGMLRLCASDSGDALPAYRRSYLEALGLSLTGSHAKASAAIDALRSAYPAETARDAAGISYLSLSSGFQAGRGRWTDDFAALVGMEGSPAVYKALADAVALIAGSGIEPAAGAIRAVGTSTFQLAEARALAGSRDFGPAVVAFRRHALDAETPVQAAVRISPPAAANANLPASDPGDPPVAKPGVGPRTPPSPLAPLPPEILAKVLRNLSRPAASDAARSFMAAAREEGAACFSHIVDTVRDWSVYPSRKYFETFWHGRFLREAQRWKEAETAFTQALAAAANASERDAAAWYVVECAWKRSPQDAVAALGKALAASRNPGYFSDLIEPVSREALVARDGATLVALGAALDGHAGARDAARMSYLCARAAQAGIITDRHIRQATGPAYSGAGEYIRARLRAAWDQEADPWYRLASAYRLGEPLVHTLEPEADAADESAPAATGPAEKAAETPPMDTVTKPGGGTPAAPEPGKVSPDEYALQLARFGMGARLRSELGARFNALSDDTIRSVAATLGASGRHSQSYRLIATLFWKAAFTPTRADAELYWPRPYREAFAAASASTGLDECLLYGLVRSESAFDPAVFSKSGAVGLTQLMPATAAEVAGRLKLVEWSLTDPEDNLAIGSAYFARLLDNLDGRVLPAVFSYNGGPTRFRRWESEYGDLPPDLLLESLSYEETRQYGRNVATAALSYAALYGEGDLRAYFAWLIGEGPRP